MDKMKFHRGAAVSLLRRTRLYKQMVRDHERGIVPLPPTLLDRLLSNIARLPKLANLHKEQR